MSDTDGRAILDTRGDARAFLAGQHRQLERLLDGLVHAMGSERRQAFDVLRRLLAVHEAAEQEIIRPRTRSAGKNGEIVARSRVDEEHEAAGLVARLEDLDIEATEFETTLQDLRTAILGHARSEEVDEFPLLGDALDDADLAGLRAAALLSETVAPTVDGVPAASGDLDGSFAAMLARARETLAARGSH